MLAMLARFLGFTPRLPVATPTATPSPIAPHELAFRVIAGVQFPPGVQERISSLYPQVTARKWREVEKAMRDFLDLCAVVPSSELVVPSRLVYEALQEFARHTVEYDAFCAAGYGGPLTLRPLQGLSGERPPGAAVWPTWFVACQQANLLLSDTTTAPPLFSLDTQLGVGDPWRYQPSPQHADLFENFEGDRLSSSSESWRVLRYSHDFPQGAVRAGYFGPPGRSRRAEGLIGGLDGGGFDGGWFDVGFDGGGSFDGGGGGGDGGGD